MTAQIETFPIPNYRAQTALAEAIAAQSLLPETFPLLFEGNRIAAGNFKNSTLYQALRPEVSSFLKQSHTLSVITAFEHVLKGKVFEQIALSFLLRQMSPTQTMITGERISTLFQALYPYSDVLNDTFADDMAHGIAGISVPDALIIEAPNEIVGYVEATVNNPVQDLQEYFRGKRRGFVLHQWQYPRLFTSAHHLFLIPQHTGERPNNEEFMVVPVEAQEIQQCVETLFTGFYRKGNPLGQLKRQSNSNLF